jgi:hypothetical protein
MARNFNFNYLKEKLIKFHIIFIYNIRRLQKENENKAFKNVDLMV